jgi:hypothetical protein
MIKLLIIFGLGFIAGLCWGAGIHNMILMSKCRGRHSIWALYGLVAVALLAVESSLPLRACNYPLRH